MRYRIDNLGVDTYHRVGFCHQCPHGFPFWVFLHMATPQRANQGEQLLLADAGTCIIYPPNYPRYLYVPDGADGLCNNWIHFSCENDDAFIENLDSLGIPINHFFTLRQYMPIINALHELIYEHNLSLPHKEEMVTALMDQMLIQISRNILPMHAHMDASTLQHLHEFEQLRKQMHSAPEKAWSVAELASNVYLCVNQFILLYRSFFGVTPKQDLIYARVAKAKSLLGTSTTLRDVALACGFKNEYYFSSTFKKIVGVSPSQYAKNAAKKT